MANASSLVGTALGAAVATDPASCRVSGYLKTPYGTPAAGSTVVLRFKQAPMGLTPTTLLLQERIVLTADAIGYVEVDLLRGAVFSVEVPGDAYRYYKEVTVPNVASVNLLDMLFPYLVSLVFDDAGPVPLTVGSAYAIPMTGTLSNGETITIGVAGVTSSSSDVAVLAIISGLSYRGLSPGTASVTVTNVDRALLSSSLDWKGDPLSFDALPAVVLPPAPLVFTVTA